MPASGVLHIPVSPETLDRDELATITGGKLKADQIRWLEENAWVYHLNRAGMPIVGRLYARLRLAGIEVRDIASRQQPAWAPDFSKVQ